jgi:Flp pilus assembly protein TadD
VRSADALGWALTRAGRPREALPWARRALALGSRDPSFRYHAGIAARDAGRRAPARARLRVAVAGRAALPALSARRALRALEGLR